MATDDETERLRSLVGPSEAAYEQLRDDLTAASALTQASMLEAGRLRGELAEMSTELARARQDQDLVQRRREMAPGAYLTDLAREAWQRVLRPTMGAAARRVGVRRPSRA